MRSAPESFSRALAAQFNGRFRVRYSVKRHTWQIEEKCDVARLAPIEIDSADDDLIRAVDGFSFFAEVTQGTTCLCPRCGQDTFAIPRAFQATECSKCGKKSIRCFWPLDDSLLEHMRSTDPNRGGYERLRKARDFNKQLSNARIDSSFRESRAVAVDDARVDIPKVGHTGKETMWLDAPAPRLHSSATQ